MPTKQGHGLDPDADPFVFEKQANHIVTWQALFCEALEAPMPGHATLSKAIRYNVMKIQVKNKLKKKRKSRAE